MCGAEGLTTAQCGHTFPVIPPHVVVPMLDDGVPLSFIALICLYRRLIYLFCAANVSTDIAKLADNSASGPPFATVCVAAAAILAKYPSRESRI